MALVQEVIVHAAKSFRLNPDWVEYQKRMDAEGLPYGERTMTYNSRLSQELGKWADTQPGGEAFHDAMFRAYFVEARDISRPEVLLEIAVVESGNRYLPNLRDVDLARTVHDDPQVALNLTPNPNLELVARTDNVVAGDLQQVDGCEGAWRLNE